MDDKMSVSLDVQLLKWQKSSSNNPPYIKLALLCDKDVEFFERLTVAKGKTAGQLLSAGFVLSPDDSQHGTIATPAKESKKEICEEAKAWMKKESIAQIPSVYAAYLCTIENYQTYSNASNVSEAVSAMRGECNVTSRGEFDTDPEALERFIKDVVLYRLFVQESLT